MKHIVLILTLFAFLAGGVVNVAHAAMPDEICSHQANKMDTASQDCVNDTDTQDKADLEQCLDCCCHNTHVMMKIMPNATMQANIKTSVTPTLNEAPRSRTLSPLYRPPIA